MKKAVSSLGLLIALSPLAMAMAQDNPNFYVGARVGASILDDTCHTIACTSKEVGAGLITGYDFGNFLAVEATYDYLGRFEARNPSGLFHGDLLNVTLAPKLNYGITTNTSVYGKIGASWWNWNAKSAEHNDWSVMTALGIDHRATDLINLRLEYQYTPGLDIDRLGPITADHHFISAGITFHFGRQSEMPAPATTPEDDYTVEETPYVEEVEIVEEVIEPEQVVVFEATDEASFAFNKAELTQGAISQLGPMLKRLQDHPNSVAIILGYTDSTGPEEYNKTLSEERAQSVADYFVNNGISADRLTVTGMGSSNPIATNDTPEGRALNRRVTVDSPEFVFISM